MLTQRQLFLRHVAQTSDAPLALEIESAKGMYLKTTDNQQVMDLIAGISVSVLGHRYPSVQVAVEQQLNKYWHTLVYGEFVLSPQVQLATLLADNLPPSLNSTYFTNSGAEATEGAMKLAKRATGRSEIIAMHNAYHGSTQGAMSLNSDSYFTQAYRPLLPDIQHIAFNNFDDIAKVTQRTAAVIVETVQAESGIHKPTEGYLRALKKRCSEVGALLILDEIQAGMGRTGTLWAFEQYGIVPDVLLLAKGLGGGMPIGAFIADRNLMHVLTNEPVLGHITTFGGHPVSCAAALATLRTLLETDFIAEVKAKEALFRQLLIHPKIKAVWSAGLWLAVELENFDILLKVIQECLKKDLLTDWFLFNNRSLRIAPPLIITKEEIEWACAVILNAIEKIA
ncbi:MAG: aspartate aminotransferase family protein [Saprospiraceae bacterium]|nr:aspartate aminotransferase family protein [Saprospiraceae bacterium]